MSRLRADAAERALLAGILVWPAKAADEWRKLEADGLTPASFGVPSHGELALAISKLVARGAPVDAVSAHDAMSDTGKASLGLDRIAALEGEATAAHVASHAGIVMRAAHRRALRRWHLAQAEEIEASETLLEPAAWVEHCERAKADCANLATSVHVKAATISSGEVIAELHRMMADSVKGVKRGSPSGFPMLDLKYRSEGGHLDVIVGRPKMGKTSLALGFTRQALFERESNGDLWEPAKRPIPVLWACDEMRNAKLAARLLSDISDVSYAGMIDPPGRDWIAKKTAALSRGSRLIREAPLDFIEEIKCGHLNSIFAAARTWRAKHPVDPDTGKKCPAQLYLDYLQRMRIDGVSKHASNEQRVSAMVIEAKTFARETDTNVKLLAQLNRDLEKREDKRPRASDIRDSGSVEQEADVIMGVFRPIEYNPNAEAMRQRVGSLSGRGQLRAGEREELEALQAQLSDAEIILCANRHGPRATIYVDFDGSRYRFSPRRRLPG